MEKPKKPEFNECCAGGSCCPCVWDEYYEKLKLYNELLEKKELSENKV